MSQHTEDVPVVTKTAPRRDIRYATFEELAIDLDAIAAAHSAGTLTTTGNWTPGQIMRHCAILLRCAYDGFPSSAPAIVRWVLTLLYKKKALSGEPLRAGFKIPAQADFLEPGDTSFDEGLQELRAQVDRVCGGEAMTHPSPIFGNLTHDEWKILQLGHCTLHMSFLSLD